MIPSKYHMGNQQIFKRAINGENIIQVDELTFDFRLTKPWASHSGEKRRLRGEAECAMRWVQDCFAGSFVVTSCGWSNYSRIRFTDSRSAVHFKLAWL